MSKQIRVDDETHDALQKAANDMRVSMGQVVAWGAKAFDGLYVVVAVNDEGSHDVVEVIADEQVAFDRRKELGEIGFSGSNLSVSSRAPLVNGLEPIRKYGPAWKEAVGWSPKDE